MSLELTEQEVEKICMEAEQQCPPVTSIDRLETIYSVPTLVGSGYSRDIKLYPSLELCIFHETYRDLTIKVPENRHLVQFKVLLSGVEDSGNHVLIDAKQSYVGGSGIQRRLKVFLPQSQPQVGVNIHIQSHLLSQFFATPTGELPAELQPLVRGDDWQQVFSPKTTEAMRLVVQQIVDCPFWGATKRLYLQGKVFELMALQLSSIMCDRQSAPETSLKPSTIARIYYAAEILRSRLEQPPSQTELAQQVGVSDRTLRRGFQALFGTTVWGYLTEQRLIQAEQLLRCGNLTVAEVVHRSGYSNQGHFAAAFKRKFGMTPKQCAMGKKLAQE
ncbi:MAG: HTH-type transcriptional activator RhaR [Chroococcidiopsis cubana SAG 39.79]|jgi:AraC-like DNA-binding protein|uniref:Transcriptional regulator, AraC family n=2 Tax=Chroococcidiopsis TaxID=54298 RepID=K9U355_CHRTP|nr:MULTISPECIES: AraC family transcriptional regulator [Chroococcidiopsis]PSB48733.1 AraC family transcriptional regulator [Cyanosarcina cf. burmensis CCALA 770]AFY89078.1 transcriptional regulator, AraC family [Chroococcidiopsis thermalis PCC 7203]MDZ4870794.1 HTH-type transcriptional activator RhaR [Chroococcidiopsis cubana SAG 39.79]PSB64861.1 AraC family transcriptional regulator [Chroococcidiopsis cubana CCALA 043]RUT10664.1 AraC family transcriptional regulator [Chroococcidiopsis cubana 